jgi:glycosyl hydrolase family 2
VLRVTLLSPLGVEDQIYETFGLRQMKVDSSAPRLLLNGNPVSFHGVALHDERQTPADAGHPAGGPLTSITDAFDLIRQAQDVNADFIRADHHPANPLLLTLADRLGLAVWEEIPLYHYTPETFQIALDRGIAQQMLAEMVLRDMNHPAVLFHGLANESSGGADRASALATLRNLDRQLDGTRLTGQAAYGYDAADSSSDNLDVAGYTFYPGVFYGGSLDRASIGLSLERFHARYPRKPIMVMEFGRWADSAGEEAEQARVFQVTYAELSARLDTQPGGFIGAAVWWNLNDYWTQRPGLQVEHFGLYRPDGSMRPVGTLVAQSFAFDSAVRPPRPPGRRILSGGEGAVVGRPGASRLLLGLLAYAVGLPTVLVGALIVLLRWRWKPSPGR